MNNFCGFRTFSSPSPHLKGTDILVNCTSIGLFPDIKGKPDLDYAGIREGMTVCDVVFNPPETPFLRETKARGAQTINGLGMLVNQAAVNFTLWTGKAAPEKLMMDTLKAEFGLG